MLRLPDRISAPLLQSLRPAARLRAYASEWGYRAVNAVLVLVLAIPGPLYPAASPGNGPTDEEIEEAIAAVADAPLDSTPLRLRKAALETLSPFAAAATPTGDEDDDADDEKRPPVLRLKLLSLLADDNALYFADEGRITSAIVLQHDRTLVRALVDLVDHDRVTRAAQQAYLQGLVLILLADRHIVELALADVQVVLDGAGAPAPRGGDDDDDEGCEFDDDDDDDSDDGLDAQLKRAVAAACAAERRHTEAIKALRRGNAASAARAFARAWTYTDRVLSVWGIEFEADHDVDGLVDIVELRIGSSVFTEDTDRDGLSDAYEVKHTIPHTMPDLLDTDEDSIPDGDEDLDEDQLTNQEESAIGTDPLVPDTDRDGLTDSAEAGLPGYDPLLPDSDGDGLTDDSELRLGADPSDPDSDGDGVLDGGDTYVQVVPLPDLGMIVELEGVADHHRSLRGHSLAEVPLFAEVPGLVTLFTALGDELAITRATVRMRYDPARVPGGDTANLRLLRYDFEEGVIEILPNQHIDSLLGEVSAEAVELGAFGIVYLPEWEASFASASLPAAASARPSSLVLASWAPPLDSGPALQIENSPTPTETPSFVATATPEPSATPEPTPAEDEIPLLVPAIPTLQLPGAQPPGLSVQQADPGDGEFVIAGGLAIQHGVAAAYDPIGRQYLAVWVDETGPASVRGQLYNEQGEPIGAELLVAQGSVGVPIRPDMVPNGTDGGFLLIWSEANGGQSVETYCLPGGGCITQTLDTYNLYAMGIGPGGGAAGTLTLVTDRLTFWSWVEQSPAYDVAYNSFSQEYLVVWNQPRGGLIANVAHPHRMLAQRLDLSGSPVGDQDVLVDRMVSSVTVTYNRARHEYLITFDTFPSLVLEYEMSAQRRHGTTLGLLGTTNLSGNVVGSQFAAAAAHDPADDLYLVTWWDSRDSPGDLGGPGDLRGRILSGTLGAVGPLQKWLDPPDPAEGVFLWEPRAAFSTVESRFLVLSGFGAGPELHGRYVLPDSAPDREAFLVASRAIQGGIAARAPDGEELPHWLVAWNQGDDVLARMYPQAPSGGVDSDFDGLTDAQELAGFILTSGTRIFTDPLEADTDGDGIPDGEELGALVTFGGRTFYTLISHPRYADSDGDGVEDFVELRELEDILQPFVPDSDNDRLSDGDELYQFGTDPHVGDTDGDEFSDFTEVVNGDDPLFYSERMTFGKGITEFLRGAICGEFCLDDPASSNVPFFIGFLGSGLLSLIPPAQIPALIADARDTIAAAGRGDLFGAAINFVAVVPYFGDVADLPFTALRFLTRHVDLLAEAATFVARADSLPKFVRVLALYLMWGDEVRDGLRGLGFSDDLVVRLVGVGVEGPTLLRVIRNLPEGQQLTRLSQFLEESLGNDVAGVIPHLKGLSAAQPRSVVGYISNIKGAYSEWLSEQLRRADGWRAIRPRHAVNAPGYDLVLGRASIVRVVDAKTVQSLSLRDITKLIWRDATGKFQFNGNYFIRQLAGDPAAEAAFRSGNVEVEIVINGPKSSALRQQLLDALGGTTTFPYLDDLDTPQLARLILTAINQ